MKRRDGGSYERAEQHLLVSYKTLKVVFLALQTVREKLR